MKSKFKSLFFWAAFFCLLISLMFMGGLLFIRYEFFDGYHDLISKILYGFRNLFVATYVLFVILAFIGRFPERLKKFEKFKYLLLLFFVLLVEMTGIVLSLPDLD